MSSRSNIIAISKCWNENIEGRNELDLLYLKTSLWSSHLWGRIPKQPAFTRQTLRDVSYKYKSVFFIRWPPVNFHINRGDFLLKIRGGPGTGSMGWSMDPGPCFVYVPLRADNVSPPMNAIASRNQLKFQIFYCFAAPDFDHWYFGHGTVFCRFLYLELW